MTETDFMADVHDKSCCISLLRCRGRKKNVQGLLMYYPAVCRLRLGWLCEFESE